MNCIEEMGSKPADESVHSFATLSCTRCTHDDDHCANEDAVQPSEKVELERLLARRQVLNRGVEAVQGPHHEARQGECEREDEEEDPAAACLDGEQHDADRVEAAADEVDGGENLDPKHRLGLERRSHDAIAHGYNQEQEEACTVPRRVDQTLDDQESTSREGLARVTRDGRQAPKVDGMRVQVRVVEPCDELLDDQDGKEAGDEVLHSEESGRGAKDDVSAQKG